MEQQNARAQRMDAHADPVVEDPQLPSMAPAPEATGPGGQDQPAAAGVMAEPPPQSDAGGETMEWSPGDQEYPDMEPGDAPPGAEGSASFAADVNREGYVRLLVEVDQGDMRVLDASIVEGPLVQPELTGAMAYEVTIGDRRVGAGAFDDLSEQHGYAPPEADEAGHRVGEVTQYQFTVRVPRSEITQDELPDLRITLVRPQTTTQLSEDITPAFGVPFEDAAVQAGFEEPPVVAALEGISLGDLPSEAAETLRRGLR